MFCIGNCDAIFIRGWVQNVENKKVVKKSVKKCRSPNFHGTCLLGVGDSASSKVNADQFEL